jgi:hypothetical protein
MAREDEPAAFPESETRTVLGTEKGGKGLSRKGNRKVDGNCDTWEQRHGETWGEKDRDSERG